jgi:hypothetical protein
MPRVRAVGEGFLGELGAWPRGIWEQTWCVREVYRKNVQKGKEEMCFFGKMMGCKFLELEN